jgi:hypothetical protein
VIRILVIASLVIALAGCASGESKATTSVERNPPTPRYAVLDVEPCVSVQSLGLRDAGISDARYGPVELVPASILGTTKGGRCVVIPRIARRQDQGCLIDTSIELQQEGDRVVVRREARRRKVAPKGDPCSLDLVNNAVALRLDEPLGDRDLVDAASIDDKR